MATSPKDHMGPLGETERAESLHDSSRMYLEGQSHVGQLLSKINSRGLIGLNLSSKKDLIEQVKAEVKAASKGITNINSPKTFKPGCIIDNGEGKNLVSFLDKRIGIPKQKT